MPPTSRIGGEEKPLRVTSVSGGGGGAAATTTTSSTTYKEYGYSPVPASPLASSVYLPTTLPTSALPEEPNESCDVDRVVIGAGNVKTRPLRAEFELEMDESGSKVLQYVAAVAANLIIFASGAMMGWTSPVTAEMKNSNSTKNPLDETITDVQGSWIGSLLPVGAVIGSLIAGWMGEKFGRKRSLLFSAVPYLIGWALIATAKNVEMIYVARIIFGIALAIDFTIVPMYCGEIAETSIRGVLGSFLQLFVTVGLLYSYSIGPYVSYELFWIFCGILPIIFVGVFMFMPESPYYLLSQGNKSEATDALARLRGKSHSAVTKELNEMQAAVDQACNTEVHLSDLFTVKANFKALMYTCAGVSFQQLTGINVVLFYTEDIFRSTGSNMDPAISTIIIGIVQVCSSAVTPIVVDRLGRRTLLFISGVGTAIGTSALGLFFYIQKVQESDVSNLGWLPIASLVIFMCTYCIGWGPLPWAIMGEMFSAEVKAKASGITVLVCWALAFVITKYFSDVVEAFKPHTGYWIFTVCCLLSIAFVVFIMPETKGKSLKQIQDELNGIKSRGYEDAETEPRKQ